jgi:hypothetical protein
MTYNPTRYLPISVQKGYFLLPKAEREILNAALEQYQCMGLTPVGALALFLCWLMVQDPEYLREHRKELKKQPLNIGLGLVFVMYGLTIRSIVFFLQHTRREPV